MAIGRTVLHLFPLEKKCDLENGWPKRDKKSVPTATHIIEYKQKETGTKHLAGKVATELSSINYGPAEWWLLLEPAPAVVGSS